MINGAHVILNSQDAEADRAFIRDVLASPGVDAGGGWLIFEPAPAEIAVQWRRTAAVRTSPPRGPQSVTLERPRPGSTGC
ncbi:hypothetical protein [Streptomyces sp. NPDC097610]|uniref:hypothetical protein n=1 Tax=Streptomyces sp. NPDC097610 TaxID=3157227 RepID=UPI00332728CC